jgi:hypothetical protein
MHEVAGFLIFGGLGIGTKIVDFANLEVDFVDPIEVELIEPITVEVQVDLIEVEVTEPIEVEIP